MRGYPPSSFCKLPGEDINPLFLQLQSRDQKLRPNAGAGSLIDLCAQPSHFREKLVYW